MKPSLKILWLLTVLCLPANAAVFIDVELPESYTRSVTKQYDHSQHPDVGRYWLTANRLPDDSIVVSEYFVPVGSAEPECTATRAQQFGLLTQLSNLFSSTDIVSIFRSLADLFGKNEEIQCELQEIRKGISA